MGPGSPNTIEAFPHSTPLMLHCIVYPRRVREGDTAMLRKRRLRFDHFLLPWLSQSRSVVVLKKRTTHFPDADHDEGTHGDGESIGDRQLSTPYWQQIPNFRYPSPKADPSSRPRRSSSLAGKLCFWVSGKVQRFRLPIHLHDS